MNAIQTQNRWKSPVLWGAVVAQLVTILITLGVIDPTQSAAINAVVASVLELAILFGIVNSPDNKNTL